MSLGSSTLGNGVLGVDTSGGGGISPDIHNGQVQLIHSVDSVIINVGTAHLISSISVLLAFHYDGTGHLINSVTSEVHNPHLGHVTLGLSVNTNDKIRLGINHLIPKIISDIIITRPKPRIISRGFYAVISGSPSVEFPISSISSTVRKNGSTSTTIVCPDGKNFTQSLLERVAGVVTIKAKEVYDDASISISDMLSFSSLSINYSRGSRNYSIVIEGTGTTTLPLIRRRVNAAGIQYETLQSNGARRVRMDLDKDIFPNDILIYDLGEFTIGQLQYIITANTKAMEITEAS